MHECQPPVPTACHSIAWHIGGWHREPTFRADIHTNQHERSDQIAAPYSALSLPEPPYRPLSGYQGYGPCRCPSEYASQELAVGSTFPNLADSKFYRDCDLADDQSP